MKNANHATAIGQAIATQLIAQLPRAKRLALAKRLQERANARTGGAK